MFIKFENVSAEIVALAVAANEEKADDLTTYRACSFINLDQSIEVDGHTLLIQGQRCALWGDWFIPVMAALKASGLQPVEYKSSESCLKWHETMSEWLDAQPVEALAPLLFKEWEKRGYLTQVWSDVARRIARPSYHVPEYGTTAFLRWKAEGHAVAPEAFRAKKVLNAGGYYL